MAKSNNNVLPVILLGGLALLLLAGRPKTGGVTGAAKQAANTAATAGKSTVNALDQIVATAMRYIGGLTSGSDGNPSSAPPTAAELDQVVSAAKAWQAAYGAAAGVTGDPYNPEG